MNGTLTGKVITARGPIEPEQLGAVMMHEHLHSDWGQRAEVPFDAAKWPLLEGIALPALADLKKNGCNAFVDMTRPPERAEPWVYQKISEMADFHLVCCTGFYREIKLGDYWAQTPDDQIWPFVRNSSVEELEEFCVQEIETGIHGSQLRAGVLKVGCSSKELTPTEIKAAKAVARAHGRTGVFISTHTQGRGAHLAQLDLLEREGVNPERVVLGHTQGHMVSEWDSVRDCMKRGAAFAMTNLVDRDDLCRAWAEAICRAFDEGLGGRVALGLDSGICFGYRDLSDNPKWRPHQGNYTLRVHSPVGMPPYIYLYTHTIPKLKRHGVTDEMLDTMLVQNPKRILPVGAV